MLPLAQILADATQSDRVIIISLIVAQVAGLATLFINNMRSDRKARLALEKEKQDREQARLDQEAKDRSILAALAAQEMRQRLAAQEREERIRTDISHASAAAKQAASKAAEGLEVNRQALDAANNVNQKIASQNETTAKATEVLAKATEVIAAKVEASK